MELPKKLADMSVSEIVAAFSASLVVIGVSYKLGMYGLYPLSDLWVFKFFNILDFAYSSVYLIFLYVAGYVFLNLKIISVDDSLVDRLITGSLLLILIWWSYFLEGESDIYGRIIFSFMLFVILTFSIFGIKWKINCIVILLIVIPLLQGNSDIRSGIIKKDFPIAVLKENQQDDKQWAVLDKLDGKILLINTQDTKELKIVELNEIDILKSN